MTVTGDNIAQHMQAYVSSQTQTEVAYGESMVKLLEAGMAIS